MKLRVTHRYAISKILAGDLQIGNLRYAPGYTLFIAPISAVGDLFGRFDERIELLFQMVLSSAIPFLLYDILRSRHTLRAAFIVAILSLIEPFSFQWAHYYTPVWLIALCLVWALWLLHSRGAAAKLAPGASGRPGHGVWCVGTLELRTNSYRAGIPFAVRKAGRFQA